MISLVALVSERSGVRARRSAKGFNCCDRCGTPLGRHPETPWRYHGTCQACGAVQIWARPSESSTDGNVTSGPAQRRSGPKGFNCCDQCGTPLGRHPEAPWRYHGTCQACGAVQIWASPSETSINGHATRGANHRQAWSGAHSAEGNRRPPVVRRRNGGFDCCERCGRPLPTHPKQTWRFDDTCPVCDHVQIWATREVRAPAPAPMTLVEAVASPVAVAVLDREPPAFVPEESPMEAVRADRSLRNRRRATILRSQIATLMTMGFGSAPR